MFRTRLRFVFSPPLLAAVAGHQTGQAQDEKPDPGIEATSGCSKRRRKKYLVHQQPETIFDYWAALKYEMQVGKFDLAGLHLS